MSETQLTDAEALALAGTTDSDTDFEYHSVGQSTYYLDGFRQRHRILTITKAANALRVYKDGALTFGVRAGRFANGDSMVGYSAVTAQSLTDDATNYIYLTASGVLTKNTTGFPAPSTAPHIPLATILTASGGFEVADITDYRSRAICSVLSGLSVQGANILANSYAVEASTAPSGSPNVLVASESGLTLTNEGAAAKNYHTLPTAAAGLTFTFIVQDTDGLRVTAAAGDTIRIEADASPAEGYIESTTVGSTVCLLAINETEWIATAKLGAWMVSS